MTVLRVNFLRARARMLRWREEKILLRSEMQWTRLYFEYKAEKWKSLTTGEGTGKDCYAHSQVALWESLVSHASQGEVMMDTEVL